MTDTKYCSCCMKWRPAEGFTKKLTGSGKAKRIKHKCAACSVIEKATPGIRQELADKAAAERRARAHYPPAQ